MYINSKCDYDSFKKELNKILGGRCDSNDELKKIYEEINKDLDSGTFLPKQVNGDNRVIPHQLYEYELVKVLENAKTYLEFLNKCDEDGSVYDKIHKIFTFRVPYYVGPLVDKKASQFAWMVRKASGTIRPWNFEKLVDLDESENAFIKRMTNYCQYLPDQEVLPYSSLLYKEFMVLNEINPIKVNSVPISVEAKQKILEYFKNHKRVTRLQIENVLRENNFMQKGDTISGIDNSIKSNLSSYHDFKGYLDIDNGSLSIEDVEDIILRITCTEDKKRLEVWLRNKSFKNLTENDIKKISRLKYSEFGTLSKEFLNGLTFTEKLTGETNTVLGFLRSRNVVLMELLSDRYTLRDELDKITNEIGTKLSLDERLDSLRASGPVKRQIYRSLDIVKSVIKARKGKPARIFVEMARGGGEKGKRTISRFDMVKEQIRSLHKNCNENDVREVNKQLEEMEKKDTGNNRLQSDALFLWCLQLGRCAYCGEHIAIENLRQEGQSNIDHIIPRCLKKDDSVLDNKVLACSKCNGSKTDKYPIPDSHGNKGFWDFLHDKGLMTDEKYRRLMRREQLTEDELKGFINRQLVETRQTTKAILTILRELYPETEIVAVKAGNVSDFRHEYGLIKSRAINDLHHAKDAFLNIVVGNVYNERFTKHFDFKEPYSLKTETIFKSKINQGIVWNGESSLRAILKTCKRNDIHLTKFAFLGKGTLFDQKPLTIGKGEIPRKQNLDPKKYGGYAKTKLCGFFPVVYSITQGRKEKKELILLPINVIDLIYFNSTSNEVFDDFINKAIQKFENKNFTIKSYPLGKHLIKIGSVVSIDNQRYIIRGKSGGSVNFSILESLVLRNRKLIQDDKENITPEAYVKRIESTLEKLKTNKNLRIDSKYDKITEERNLALLDILLSLANTKYVKMPEFKANDEKLRPKNFKSLGDKNNDNTKLVEQIKFLLSLINRFKSNNTNDCRLNMKLTNWKRKDVRIIHSDFSGLFESASQNLFDFI